MTEEVKPSYKLGPIAIKIDALSDGELREVAKHPALTKELFDLLDRKPGLQEEDFLCELASEISGYEFIQALISKYADAAKRYTKIEHPPGSFEGLIVLILAMHARDYCITRGWIKMRERKKDEH